MCEINRGGIARSENVLLHCPSQILLQMRKRLGSFFGDSRICVYLFVLVCVYLSVSISIEFVLKDWKLGLFSVEKRENRDEEKNFVYLKMLFNIYYIRVYLLLYPIFLLTNM